MITVSWGTVLRSEEKICRNVQTLRLEFLVSPEICQAAKELESGLVREPKFLGQSLQQ